MMKKESTEVYLVRHGETDWNTQGLLQGHRDIPLNSNGHSQAQELQQLLAHIPFAVTFSSDLSRAKKTAEVISHPREIPFIQSESLRETHFGPLEGKKHTFIDELKQQQIQTNNIPLSKDEKFKWRWHPEIESSFEVHERTTKFLNQHAPHYKGLPILVVSHGGVLRSFLQYFDAAAHSVWTISNCSYIHFTIGVEGHTLKNLNGIKKKEI
ncbi:MAG: histidine phosphatase family protein [Parachlamydiaceae bacterium]|nr:histidine phosphatase family protein [Parachlamydiaceae bacterium]